MVLWQEKAGARYMYYVLSLAWLLEQIQPLPLQPKPKPEYEPEPKPWWKSIVEMEADQRIPGAPQSRQEQGPEHTRSANKFSSFWRKVFSMPHARMQVESIAQWIGTCQKA